MLVSTPVDHSLHHFKNQRAFSLLELLAVIAVIGTMMALAMPSLASFTSPAGRKGAVIVVMNALEQARVSAIESGRETVVLFWKKNGVPGFPSDEPDSLMILRRTEATSNWEPLSRWVKLPSGVLFHTEDANSKILTIQPDTSILDAVPGSKPTASQAGAVQFTSSGAVNSPSTSGAGLYIAFTEGQRDAGADTLAVNKQKSGGREVVSLARYTGRATMDIVSTQ